MHQSLLACTDFSIDLILIMTFAAGWNGLRVRRNARLYRRCAFVDVLSFIIVSLAMADTGDITPGT